MRYLFTLLCATFSLSVYCQVCDSVLFSESFGASKPAGWTGDFNTLGGGLVEGWITSTGPTITSNTGPELPSEGSHFAYMESSGPAGSNSIYTIQGPPINIPLDGSSELSFDFLMYGSDIGLLQIEVINGSNMNTLFRRVGQQHTDGSLSSWERTSHSLSAYAGSNI